MILNRLIVPENNNINFVLNHVENGEKYELPENSKYYILISGCTEPFEKVCFYESETENFNFAAAIPSGEYIFEIGTVNEENIRTVILPALDERLRPMNQLLVLRRLENE